MRREPSKLVRECQRASPSTRRFPQPTSCLDYAGLMSRFVSTPERRRVVVSFAARLSPTFGRRSRKTAALPSTFRLLTPAGPLSLLRARRFLRPRFFRQMPRVAVLLELRDNMVGDGVATGFGQGLPQPAHDLAGAAERERQVVAEHVAAGHPVIRT